MSIKLENTTGKREYMYQVDSQITPYLPRIFKVEFSFYRGLNSVILSF